MQLGVSGLGRMRVLVINIELAGDVLLLVRAFVEQSCGAAGEKVLRADEQPKPFMLSRIVKKPEVLDS